MNRDSGAENPGQRTVADLLKEYGGSDDSGSSQRGDRRRRRRAEDTTETAPHAIIDRVLSDSGQLRAIRPDEEPPPELRGRSGSEQAGHQADPQQAQPQQAQPQQAQQQAQPQQAQQPGPPEDPAPPGAAPPRQAPPAQSPPQQAPGQQPSAQQPPVQQPPAQQPAVQQQQAQQQSQGAADDFSNAPVGPEGANFWAQRFAAAGSPPGQSPPEDQSSPENQPPAGGDVEPTVQQQPVSPRPQPYPRSQPAGEEATEKLPMMNARERAGGTAMFATSAASGQDTAAGFGDAYDFDGDVDTYGDVDDYEDFDDYGDEPYGADEDDDLDRPAGLPADDVDDEARSPGREWVGQVAQAVVGLLCGAVVFFGFSWLWTKNSVAAFVAALVVTGCLVLLARRLRGDDLQTTLLAVLAGLFCTVSPAALLMLGQ